MEEVNHAMYDQFIFLVNFFGKGFKVKDRTLD